MSAKLVLALPSKGRLVEQRYDMFAKAGLVITKSGSCRAPQRGRYEPKAVGRLDLNSSRPDVLRNLSSALGVQFDACRSDPEPEALAVTRLTARATKAQVPCHALPQYAAGNLASERVVEVCNGTHRVTKARSAHLQRVCYGLGDLHWAAASRTSVLINRPEQLLQPQSVSAIHWADARRVLPNIGAVGAWLDKNDLDAEHLEFICDPLGPSFDSPL